MKATVIIPTHNYAALLPQAVMSVYESADNSAPIQVVVHDGSTDNTRHVVEALQQQVPVQYHQQPNAGKAAATRTGIELATGDIIFALDADEFKYLNVAGGGKY